VTSQVIVAVARNAPPGCPARDALRARLGVSNQAASELLRQLRADQGLPPGASRAA
jgi:predicted transcriptional regulator